MTIRTRMAPSPTGMFHIGSLRTSLYDYLLAHSTEQGKFVLRIEDTDQSRLVEGAYESILDACAWAAILPDEGVTYDSDHQIVELGDCGPYIQSKRLAIYDQYINQLIDAGHAYYAFDTAEALDEMRNRQRINKQPPKYERHSMMNSFTLSPEEVDAKIAAGEPYVVRMVVPDDQEISFTDMVRGEITVQSKEVDEQILRKSDGFPTYHLAVVVDDHLMNITHVLRGDEWISSTPKHVLLYQYFGWEAPTFAHLPVLVNETGKKLSKRHGDVAVSDFIAQGYLPEAMINFIALLGWNPGTEQELFSLTELAQAFRMDQVQKKPAFFDREKLAWFNKQWMAKLEPRDLTMRTVPYLIDAGLITDTDIANRADWLDRLVQVGRERITVLSELPEMVGFLFALPDYDVALLKWKKADLTEAKETLSGMRALLAEQDASWFVSPEDMKQDIVAWIKENGYGIGNVMWPLRVALSGLQNSPGPFEIMSVLSKEEILNRIDHAVSALSE
jgi:nondiscriminating glutamyl-tRNA synthetase